MKYPKSMDKNIIPLCDYLNSLEGVKTNSSCEGHGEAAPHVFFTCTDPKTLVFLASIDESWWLESLTKRFPTKFGMNYLRYAKKAFPKFKLKWLVELSYCTGPMPERFNEDGPASYLLTATKGGRNVKAEILRVVEYYQRRKALMETDEFAEIWAEFERSRNAETEHQERKSLLRADDELYDLEMKLGYKFQNQKNIGLVKTFIQNRNYKKTKTKEKDPLCTIGDAVLEMAIMNKHYRRSSTPEDLTAALQKFGNNVYLTSIAHKMGLAECITWNNEKEKKDFINAKRAGGDLLEGLIGAIYLDRHRDVLAAQEVIYRMFKKYPSA